jgi:hypothetical protein
MRTLIFTLAGNDEGVGLRLGLNCGENDEMDGSRRVKLAFEFDTYLWDSKSG